MRSARCNLLTLVAYALGVALSALLLRAATALFRRGRPTSQRRVERPSTAPAPVVRRPVAPESAEPAFEPRDASPRVIALAGIVFVVALVLIVVVTSLIYFDVTDTRPRLQVPPPGQAISASPPTPLPPPPQLITDPGAELRAMRTYEDAALHSYAWVDRAHGIVRIPIDRAMDLVAAAGLPTRPGADQVGFRDEGFVVPSESSSGRAPEELRH